MRIRLVSGDSDLGKLCSEILQEFPVSNWHLSIGDDGNAPDLYLWDVDPGKELPLESERLLARYVYLVNRNDVGRFRAQHGNADANILLKPVSRTTLAAFLGYAVGAHQEHLSAAGDLRADRDDMLQCLIHANLKLQEFDQDRTNFLARALHEFRAPLTAINGYCGLLLKQVPGPLNHNQMEVLQRSQHSIRRLSRLVSAMVQLSVSRQVKTPPQLAEGDLRACIEQALHEVGPTADSKRLSISVDLHPETPTLHFEAGQIEQVLINLMDNACKFTPRSGHIGVSGYPYYWERRAAKAHATVPADRRTTDSVSPNVYRVDIFNSGPLIPWGHLEEIFEEYTSYAGGSDRSGGGLGLAICRLIITQHEGRVWAENTDKGPMFSFVLPLCPRQHGAESNSHGVLAGRI
jgi:signal transduction histidine kinase